MRVPSVFIRGRFSTSPVREPIVMLMPLLSRKAERFTESVIRGMSIEAAKHGAVNLAQGMPDFPAPAAVKDAAYAAIQANINQYAVTWGAADLRQAIAEHAAWHLGLDVDPDREITVTCGSTEAMLVALLSTAEPAHLNCNCLPAKDLEFNVRMATSCKPLPGNDLRFRCVGPATSALGTVKGKPYRA